MSDGMLGGEWSVILILSLFIAIILALCGAIIGALLGLIQWLVLRKWIPKSGKWVWATSLGVAVGAPLGWLVYMLIFYSPIANRPDGFYFSFSYEYIAFGVLLGFSVGVSQWSVLKNHFSRTELWIVALPVFFTLGISFANIGRISKTYILSVHQLIQAISAQFPNVELSNIEVFMFLDIAIAFIAWIGTCLLISVTLGWLLRFPKIQREG